MVTTIGSIFHFHDYLAKLQYFTNLGFSEIRGPISLPKVRYLLGAQNSCEVAIIWPDLLPWLPVASMIFMGAISSNPVETKSFQGQKHQRIAAAQSRQQSGGFIVCLLAIQRWPPRIPKISAKDGGMPGNGWVQKESNIQWYLKWFLRVRIFFGSKKNACCMYHISLFKHGTYVHPTILFKSSP